MVQASWLFTIICVSSVGLAGILPVFFQDSPAYHDYLQYVMACAAGVLLSDLFLESLDDIYERDARSGKFLLIGLGISFIAEKVLGFFGSSPNEMSAFANLVANALDNFIHGLTVTGACLQSTTRGLFVTFAVLLHEIPHEFGDFAIILRGGFQRWTGAVLQIATAFIGVLAVILVKVFCKNDDFESRYPWVFSGIAGSILYITLVTILPDLQKEDRFVESSFIVILMLIGFFYIPMVNWIKAKCKAKEE